MWRAEIFFCTRRAGAVGVTSVPVEGGVKVSLFEFTEKLSCRVAIIHCFKLLFFFTFIDSNISEYNGIFNFHAVAKCSVLLIVLLKKKKQLKSVNKSMTLMGEVELLPLFAHSLQLHLQFSSVK